ARPRKRSRRRSRLLGAAGGAAFGSVAAFTCALVSAIGSASTTRLSRPNTRPHAAARAKDNSAPETAGSIGSGEICRRADRTGRRLRSWLRARAVPPLEPQLRLGLLGPGVAVRDVDPGDQGKRHVEEEASVA